MFANDNATKITRYVTTNDTIPPATLFTCLITGSHVMLRETRPNNRITYHPNEINTKKATRLMINVAATEASIKCKFVNRLLIIVPNG